MHRSRTIPGLCAFFALLFWALSLPAAAQTGAFAPGWDLDPAQSNIRFQSIKNETKVESSSFATFNGSIEPDGTATIHVLLDSVDTLVDLRNVRMRFLFFETFRYPEATISLKLTPDMVADLPVVRRKTVNLDYTFDLHGVQKQMTSPVTITLLSDDLVSVASAAPISIAVGDFELAENVHKLEQAVGGVVIVPSATVTFDFMFGRRGTPAAPTPVIDAPVTSVALETQDNFSAEECVGRFEVLSRTGNIYFRTGSARLDADSFPLLGSVVDIVERCPTLNVVISGFTDSDGDPNSNQRLSEARAQSVVGYLVDHGVTAGRLRAVGYGEADPVAPNDTARNKGLNRRIEFAADGA
jgi:outer membrane protein OmpA-like peptidoglycan-associated protein/polyisoprenoid-binding protein YceI